MKQYTIKGFADLLITSTQFNNQKTRDKKLLLLDRCNWLISSIIRLHIKLNEPYGKYLNGEVSNSMRDFLCLDLLKDQLREIVHVFHTLHLS